MDLEDDILSAELIVLGICLYMAGPLSGKGISTPILDPSAFSRVSVPSENAPFGA